MQFNTLEHLLRIRQISALYVELLDLLEQVTGYDSAAILEPQSTGDWAITAWRHLDQWIPSRLITAFRSQPDKDPLFQPVFNSKQVTTVAGSERLLLWRHAQSTLMIPLIVEGNFTALVTLDSTSENAFTESTITTIRELHPWIELAFQNAQQFSTIQQSTVIMTTVHEDERDSIADVLHDDIADVLSIVKKSLFRSQKSLEIGAIDDATIYDISLAITQLGEVVENARRLSHTLGAKRLLNRFDLIAALEILVDNFSHQAQIDIEFDRDLPGELHLDSPVKIAVYRVVQEALTNVAKYAGVDTVQLRIFTEHNNLIIHVRDEGHGFEVSKYPLGIGLIGMRQRTLLHGGKFEIYSQIGHGTHIIATFPLIRTHDTTTVQVTPQRTIINLTAFAKLYGYLRYFYPHDTALYADWESIAIEGVQFVENVSSDLVLQERLLALFSPIAPDLIIDFADKLSPFVPSLAEDYVMLWRHHGFGVGNSLVHLSSQQDTTQLQALAKLKVGFGNQENAQNFYSEREIHLAEELPGNLPSPDQPFEVYLTENLICRLPLALYTQDARQSREDMLKTLIDIQPRRYQVEDAQTQGLAMIIILWNVFQHFYPKPLERWHEHLHEAFDNMLGGIYSIEQILRLLIAQLQDDAARIRLHSTRYDESDRFVPPFVWDFIGDDLSITHVLDDSQALEIGDIIETIDGLPTAEVIRQAMVFVSGTLLEHRKSRALRYLSRGEYGSYIALNVRRNGKLEHLRVARTIQAKLVSDQPKSLRLEVITELENGIVYMDLTRLQRQQLLRSIARLQNAGGLILDARGVVRTQIGAIETLTAHLIEADTSLPELHVPCVYKPDQSDILYNTLATRVIQPRTPHLEMPVAVLIDHRTSGQIENYTHVLKDTGHYIMIGQPTAGAIGYTDVFTLFDSYDVSWTVTCNQADERFTGVKPDIWVQDLYTSDDEILQQAISWMRNTR